MKKRRSFPDKDLLRESFSRTWCWTPGQASGGKSANSFFHQRVCGSCPDPLEERGGKSYTLEINP